MHEGIKPWAFRTTLIIGVDYYYPEAPQACELYLSYIYTQEGVLGLLGKHRIIKSEHTYHKLKITDTHRILSTGL